MFVYSYSFWVHKAKSHSRQSLLLINIVFPDSWDTIINEGPTNNQAFYCLINNVQFILENKSSYIETFWHFNFHLVFEVIKKSAWPKRNMNKYNMHLSPFKPFPMRRHRRLKKFITIDCSIYNNRKHIMNHIFKSLFSIYFLLYPYNFHSPQFSPCSMFSIRSLFCVYLVNWLCTEKQTIKYSSNERWQNVCEPTRMSSNVLITHFIWCVYMCILSLPPHILCRRKSDWEWSYYLFISSCAITWYISQLVHMCVCVCATNVHFKAHQHCHYNGRVTLTISIYVEWIYKYTAQHTISAYVESSKNITTNENHR